MENKLTDVKSLTINDSNYDILGDIYYSTTELASVDLGFGVNDAIKALFVGNICFHLVTYKMSLADIYVLMPATIHINSHNGMEVDGKMMFINNQPKINCEIAFVSFEGDVTEFFV